MNYSEIQGAVSCLGEESDQLAESSLCNECCEITQPQQGLFENPVLQSQVWTMAAPTFLLSVL